MAILCRVVAFVFIPLFVLTAPSNAEESRHHDDVQDVAILRDLVYELRNTLQVQTSRFGMLEKRLAASERKINLLVNDKKRNEKVIIELARRLAKVESHDLPPQPSSEFKYRNNSSTEIEARVTEVEDEEMRNVRQSSSASPVAFYAYMSASQPSPGANQILKFDSVKINVGNGYHVNTGVFMAPDSGYYVFTWNIRVRHGVHSTELVVNNAIYGALYTDHHTSANHDGHATGVAVAYVNTGDEIYVQMQFGKCWNTNVISSDNCGRSSFAGWKI